MKNILIVEDDKSIAELQRDYLEINQFKVEICNEGICALTKIKEDYDLIILDVMLPGVDGFELLKKIRETKDIPVLMVTARREEIDLVRGLGLGADDYITKPFSPSELVARVKAHIAKYDRIKASGNLDKKKTVLTINGLEIDKESRRVHINAKEVFLAQKEYELLLFLAQNPNRVFSKDELFERIWGLDSLGDVATVTVHVARLREKIETNPSKPQYVETVWGAGYRFK
jgi:two-component system OmpR family response regulator